MSQSTFLQNGELVTILIKKKEAPFISLRVVLLVTYVIIGVIPLLLMANTILHSMQEYFVEERKQELLSQANVIAGQLASNDFFFNQENQESLEEMVLQTGQDEDFRVLILDASAMVVYDTGYQEVGKTYLLPEVLEALEKRDVAREQEDGTVYAAASIVGSSSQHDGVVLIADSLQDVRITVGNIGNKAYFMLAVLLVAVILIMVVISRLFTEPLKRIIRVIQKMAEGHLEQRIVVTNRTHNEIVDLALSCNQMADQLEKVESSRQQFVSNVSHELKTPLSSIKVLSESILLQEDVPKEMYVEFLHDINSEIDRMTAIINDLLTLVKLDQKEIPLNFVETDLNHMMEDIIKRMTPLAAAKQIQMQYIKEKDVSAEVDEMKMTLAISNLVDNAVKYTPEGGTVTVVLDADHQNAFMTVTDTGIGIPESEVNRIFERFYRVDKTRDRETGGTGLGLSITHGTVMMHNGSIKVNSKEEEGTSIQVRIPLHQNVGA